MRKVLFVCKGHPNIAGAQRYLKTIADIFSTNAYELHYAFHAGDGTRVFDEISKSRLICTWEYDWRHLGFRRSIEIGLRLFKRICPDMIVFNTSDYRVLGPIWASFLVGIPRRIMIVHWSQSEGDLPIFRWRKGFPVPIPSRYSIQTRFQRGLSFSLLSRLIFVNDMTRRAYKKLYGVPLAKGVTIYNGINLKAFSPNNLRLFREKIRANFDAGINDIVVFSAGNLTEVKGYEYLIKAAYMLKKMHLPIKWWVAGQGELRNELESTINSLGLSKDVLLLGYRDDVPRLLGASDIFCIPSLNEGLPYSLLEAMAASLPVVASNVGGIPEVISDGREGILIPPMDSKALVQAIKTLAMGDALRKKMGTLGRETVKQRFTVEKMLERTKNILLE